MDWKKILLKLVEEGRDCRDTVNIMRKFSNFQIIHFSTSGHHNDMNKVSDYLTEHASQHVFKELFRNSRYLP